MAYPRWRGVFPAATTQFRKDLTLDLEATARHLEVVINSGVTGLVMLGSLGENLALSENEKLQVLQCALEVSAGRVPVITGVAENTTENAIRWIAQAKAAGVHGAMLLPCMVYKSDREETLSHYARVASSTDLPLIAYNNPIGYGVDLTPEMFCELAKHENIVAIKESCGDVRRITDLINATGDRYVIFAGVDDLALECAMLGATGWIAGIGLAFPKENQRLWDLAMAGKYDEAVELYRWYTPLLHLDVGLKFVQKIKLAIQEVGLGSEWVRSPRLPLSGTEREEALRVIHEGIAKRPALN